MGLYESIQYLIEVTPFSPDTLIALVGLSFFVYAVCDAAVFGLVVWCVCRGLYWLLDKVAKKNNAPGTERCSQ